MRTALTHNGLVP